MTWSKYADRRPMLRLMLDLEAMQGMAEFERLYDMAIKPLSLEFQQLALDAYVREQLRKINGE